MTGYLRYIFALCVIYAHFGPVNQGMIGGIAVFGFYVLSGFLMTRALVGRYEFNLRAFSLNRFLRLYPLFFLVTAFVVAEVVLLPAASTINGNLRLPASPLEWLQYLSIVFADRINGPLLIPPTWSIGIEIINYAILFLVTARSRRWAWIMAGLGLAYHLWSFATGGPFSDRYFVWYAAILPFSLGALLYYEGDRAKAMTASQRAWGAGIAFVAWLSFAVLGALHGLDNPFLHGLTIYGALASIVVFLFVAKDISLPPKLKSGDRRIAELSYPIFLAHYAVGVIVSLFLLGGEHLSLLAFALTAVAATIVAVPLALAGGMIEPIRDRVRKSARAESDASALPVITPAG